MANMKPVDPSSLSLRTHARIAEGLKKLGPQSRGETKYIIHDAAGLELGESSGATKAQALVSLYKMDGLRLSLEEAEQMILAKRVSFTIVA